MFRVVMLYPKTNDSHFDTNYFTSKHIPQIRRIFKDLRLHNIEVQQDIASAMPGQPAPFAGISSFLFENLEGFQQGMATQGGWIVGDVPNYTNVQPQIQISKVLVAE